MTVDRYDLFADCPVCARVCIVEIPDCSDGHEDDCPERICVECGTALVVGVVQPPAPADHRRSAA